MRDTGLFVAFVCAIAMVDCQHAQTAEPIADNELVGTWKLVVVRYGGYPDLFNETNRRTLKHITPTHSMTVSYFDDGRVFSVSGGNYTLKECTYTETIEFEKSPKWGDSKDEAKSIKEQSKRTFDVSISGTTLHLTLREGDEGKREELWQRVRGK